MAQEFVIETTQFKRGTKAVLTARLVSSDLGQLKAGEPAFETDTGQLKIGTGVHDYAELPYVGNDVRFVIHDPINNQVLAYDAANEKWLNKSILELIPGYSSAKQGEMLVKDRTKGIVWTTPVTADRLNEVVVEATALRDEAGQFAHAADTAKGEAQTSAANAYTINQTTMQWVNDKFWWGTLEEYNALEKIDAGTFYFIRAAE